MGAAMWAAGIAASTGNMIASAKGRKKGREFAEEENRKQRVWQEEMSNTRYRRGMSDMRKAGLNPILMASGGFGAGPAGAGMQAPTDQSVDVTGSIQGGAAAIAQGMNIRLQRENIENAEATRRVLKVEKSLKQQQKETSWYHGNESYIRGRSMLGAAAKGDELSSFYKSPEGRRVARHGEYINTYGGVGSSAASAAGGALKFVPGPAGSLMRGRFK